MHSRIYDLTRWSFLFGREMLLRQVARLQSPRQILEVGCGTGRNIESMCRLFPQAEITGIDLSVEMLAVARRRLGHKSDRVTLINDGYDRPVHSHGKPFDLVVCSYALSMFNPGWERAIECAKKDLADDGLFALVDFHRTPVPSFRRWMSINHVRMEGHLRPLLTNSFKGMIDRTTAAYGGLWQYLMFVGQNAPDASRM
ncbi:MAG: class I SAM-dependent methyltransferase [Verrucomicrobiaceae bacterium]|nr:class I SAM-dependent methyltransferase [Verrucomicrobiaceae bacterium]